MSGRVRTGLHPAWLTDSNWINGDDLMELYVLYESQKLLLDQPPPPKKNQDKRNLKDLS